MIKSQNLKIFLFLFVGLVAFFAAVSISLTGVYAEDISNIYEVNSFSEFEETIDLLFGGENCEQNSDSQFALKRLIVLGEVKSFYGAETVITGYKNYTILSFSTEQETSFAYEMLCKDSSLNVIIDSKISASSAGNLGLTSYSQSYENWGIDAIGADDMNEYLLENGSSEELVVVVLDSGINVSHPFFNNRLLIDSNGDIVGKSYYTTTNESESDFDDDNGHGSHVSGIITSLTPSNVKILPIKILNDKGSGDFLYFVMALERVDEVYSEQYNIACVNISAGGATNSYYSSQMDALFQSLSEKGILTVVAAGNDQLDSSGYMPANSEYVITVSAVKQNGNTFEFDKSYSNFGSSIDISAPGTEIYSAYLDNYCVRMDGTSMAAPQVSGAVALLCLNSKYWSGDTPIYTADQIKAELLENVVDLGDEGWDKFYGYGMIDFTYYNVEDRNRDVLDFYDNSTILDENNFIEFDEQFYLSISKNGDYLIYYTTDGTIPNTSSNLYTSPISIENSGIYKFIAIQTENGEVVSISKLYTIDLFNPTDSLDNFFVNENGVLTEYTGHFTSLEILDMIDGIEVEALGEYLFYDTEIEYVSLPGSCTIIEEYCFSNCSNLMEISFNFVETIGAFAFENCTLLDEIDLNGVKYFGVKQENFDLNGHVFENCMSLDDIYLANIVNAGDKIFNNSSAKKVVLGNSFTATDYYGEPFEGLAIYGYTGSSAQSYANKFGNKFFSINQFALQNNLPSSSEVKKNESLSLQVTAAGYGLTYQWFKTEDSIENGVELVGQNSRIFNVDTSEVGLTKYFVKITNWDGSVIYSQICSVNVTAPQSFELKFVIVENSEEIKNYYEGDRIELISKPVREGYDFIGWYFDQDFTNQFNLTYMPPQNLTIYAKWEKKQFSVDIEVSGGGRVSPSENFQIYYGESATILFQAETGYEVSKIILNGEEILEEEIENVVENGLLVQNVTSNCNIQVVFSLKAFNLTFVVGDTTYKNQIYYGEEISAPKIDVDERYQYFDGWYSSSSFQNKSNLVFMPAQDTTLYGRIVLKQFNLLVSSSENGAFQTSSQSISYPNDAVIRIFPENGYVLSNIKVDGKVVSGEDFESSLNSGEFVFSILKYSFEDDSQIESHTIEIEFSARAYQLVFDYNYQGGGEEELEIDFGARINLIAPTREGYTFAGWFEDEWCQNQFELTSMPAKNLRIYAKWNIDTYEIEVVTEGDESSSQGETAVLNYGESLVLKIEPSYGYHVRSISVDGEYLSAQEIERAVASGLEFTNVNKDHKISVVYDINKYKINLTVSGDLEFVANKDLSSVEHGSDVLFKTKGDLGGYRVEVYVDDVLVGTNNGKLLIENVEGNMNIDVEFIKIPKSNTVEILIIVSVCLFLLAGAIVLTVILIKRKRNLNRYM